MKYFKLPLSLVFIFVFHTITHAESSTDYLRKIESHDMVYIEMKGPHFFKQISKGQKPLASVVTCSDSRVQSEMLDNAPEGHLFIIRNIGNQLTTSLGSVEFGISHLNSPLLLSIGHSRCGAIDAARGDYSKMEFNIIKELDTIHIPKGIENIEGVKMNVNNQVSLALKQFKKEIKNNKLMIVGLVYDFADDMKQGAGKLNIININGETDYTKIEHLSKLLYIEPTPHSKK